MQMIPRFCRAFSEASAFYLLWIPAIIFGKDDSRMNDGKGNMEKRTEFKGFKHFKIQVWDNGCSSMKTELQILTHTTFKKNVPCTCSLRFEGGVDQGRDSKIYPKNSPDSRSNSK